MSKLSAKIVNYLIILLLLSVSITTHAKDNKILADDEKNFVVTMKTTHGDIVFMLLNETPKHRDNFCKLVREKFFDKVLVHRVIKDFMIQMGDNGTKIRTEKAKQFYGEGGANYTVEAEINPKFYHYRGAVAAAREPDTENPTRASSGSHFYIVQSGVTPKMNGQLNKKIREGKFNEDVVAKYRERGGTPHLDGEYTIFGYVLTGIEVVDSIAAEECNDRNLPLKNVEILSVKVEKIDRKIIDEKYKHYAN